MSETPDTRVHSAQLPKPKLVIFDDKVKLLHSFICQCEALGYDVTGVYVSDGVDFDHLIKDGHFKRGNVKPVAHDDWRAQDKPTKPEHTLDSVYAEAADKVERGHSRYGVYKDLYGDLLALPPQTRAIKSKTEMRALLQELQPDFVLSDQQMRDSRDYMEPHEAAASDDVIMGYHVMAAAGEILPHAKRAVHTGMFALDEERLARYSPEQQDEWRGRYTTLCARENEKYAGHGFGIFPKDEPGEERRIAEVDAYFGHPGRAPEEKSWEERVKESQARHRPTVMVIDDKFDELKKYAEELYLREFNVIAVHVPLGERPHDEKELAPNIPLHKAYAVRDVLRLARDLQPDCVLSDRELGWENARGDELLEELRFELPETVLALHTKNLGEREHADGYDRFDKSRGLYDIAAYFDEQLGPKGRSPA